MTPDILMENQGRRLHISLPLLLCFALYGSWQMGIIYFSGTAASIGGRTPIPMDVGNLSVLVAAGYLLSIAWLVFLPRRMVWAERGAAIAALASAIGLYLPLPAPVLAVCYSFHCLCCVFMVGFETGILVNLLSEKSVLQYLTLAYPVCLGIVAILQNDVYQVPFEGFRLFMVIALALMLVFFFRLPARVWPAYVKKEDGLVFPKRYFAGLVLLGAMGALIVLLGSAVAENVEHGLSVLYGFGAIGSFSVWVLWKYGSVTPIRMGSVLACISALGFLLSVVAQAVQIPLLSLAACAMLGAGYFVCNLSMYYGFVMMKHYPSRFIPPVIIGSCLLAMVLHTFLLELFRNNLNILYAIYLAIAVAMVILYLALEPYLIHSFGRGASPEPEFQAADDGPEQQEPSAAAGPSVAKADAGPRASSVVIEPEAVEALAAACAFDALSGQEFRLAELIMQGYTNGEMAGLLKLSENTVKYHRKNLYAKLHIHSKRELFALAKRENNI